MSKARMTKAERNMTKAERNLIEMTKRVAEAACMTELGTLIVANAAVIRDSHMSDAAICEKYWQRDEQYRRMVVSGYGYAYEAYAMREAYAMIAAERGIDLGQR